jgi:hypothetical protein
LRTLQHPVVHPVRCSGWTTLRTGRGAGGNCGQGPPCRTLRTGEDPWCLPPPGPPRWDTLPNGSRSAAPGKTHLRGPLSTLARTLQHPGGYPVGHPGSSTLSHRSGTLQQTHLEGSVRTLGYLRAYPVAHTARTPFRSGRGVAGTRGQDPRCWTLRTSLDPRAPPTTSGPKVAPYPDAHLRS